MLLGERVWRDDFDADPAILGRSLRANGDPATVIGVMPAGFGFPFAAEVWVPRRLRAGDPGDAQIVARLKPDVSLTRARACDMAILVAVGLLVIGGALLAAFAPLRRALRVDPTIALRCE